MSAEIVNLRRARKDKSRVERERVAEERRRAFGRSKAEKAHEEAERTLRDRHLDGHRREPD
jgi:hypothetical protein